MQSNNDNANSNNSVAENLKSEYQWKPFDRAPDDVIQRFPELPDVGVQMLVNRDMTQQEDVDRFLTPDYGQDQHDPFLFRDMKIVVDRMKQALEKKEKVVVYGDYDADGVCGAAVLYKTLYEIGIDVSVYLPHRDTEGYGLNKNAVKTLADEGTNLMITVDCGISNHEEVAYGVELGMDIIVTDHHSEPPVLPSAAIAVLNPKLSEETYPFEFLAGVGVGFKVCQALIREFDLGEAFEKWLLDMVAISTVTDFVSLVGENRVFVKYGLVVLRKNMRPGLRQLYAAMGVDAHSSDTQTIGFQIGPHINAAGRLNHANAALKLLIEEDESEAAKLAADLVKTNKERRGISDRVARAAMAQAREQEDEFLLVVRNDDCPVGLVGLVAGKLSSEFARPTFMITNMGGEIMGSGRSIEQFNLVDGLQSMDELFVKYGGHPMACGFTLKDEDALAQFTKRMRARAREQLEGVDLRKSLPIEKMMSLSEVDWRLSELIDQFAPFGEGNPEPVFASEKVTVRMLSAVGKTKAHLKMVIEQDGKELPCIGFRLGKWQDVLTVGSTIDVAYTVGVNEWNGNRELQLVIKDLRQAL